MKVLLILALLFPLSVFAEETSPTEDKIRAALDHDRRTEAEKARDKNRNPIETLKFLGLEDDMTVLELLPGGGWYTKILGPVLEENGKLHISIGAERTGEMIADLPGFGSTEVIPFDRENFNRAEGDRRISVPEFSFGIRKIDLVLTFRNMHNFTAEGRANLNAAAVITWPTTRVCPMPLPVRSTRKCLKPILRSTPPPMVGGVPMVWLSGKSS